ncbi:MAG: DUF177 domain-containing protein [Parvibaculum sp.]|uniref:YceD family protein n=1 Tax=Parvibaculum sp. TaxID=2024848 RepID=UPI0025F18237|nr:DUF177 domain-containing protein [Parvibaculum sp.]MCE9650222.1 DUF177 domain-containing protein [Parvibaculum sp.]
MSANQTSAPEFSIPLAVADVPQNGTTVPFEAKETVRVALAKRFGLIELRAFKGKATIKPWRRHGLSLEGTFTADLTQTCVATLEPLDAHLSEKFQLHYLPEEMIERDAAAAEREIVVDVQSEDPPEPIVNGAIDVGEAMAELLAVAIDPYPRKPGVAFEGFADAAEEGEEKPANPFSALEKLKKKD